MAEAYVRARRGDMVVQLAPGAVPGFRASAAADRAAGYHIELLVLAVRPADSRQGTAVRYARDSRLGPGARYTTAAGHDACLRALPDVVAAAEIEHLVDAVTVMRRDHTALYRNARTPSGRWARPARAAAVLLAEQHRPYTDQEAAAFLAAQHWLLRAMPQYRGDLHDIARLARPLLPARLRPGALTIAATTRLPVRPSARCRSNAA